MLDPKDEAMHHRLVTAWASAFCDLDLSLSPPALAGQLYALVPDLTGCADPFAPYKEKSNQEVQKALPRLIRLVRQSPDPLFTALELAIIGNYMDAGAPGDHSWTEALEHESDAEWASRDYPGFVREVKNRPKILILGDNAGEIGLDSLLIQELQRHGCTVTYAVRGRPILNDATMEDARLFGLPDICRVVSSGVDTPGTVLERCSPKFLDILNTAELIISKGQGNFEALMDEFPGIYYAFKVKCPVVAKLSGQPEKSSVFARI
jgi:hypothetical protein